MAIMEIMGQEGDTKIIWDKSNPDEVENARRTFNELVGQKKFIAYRVEGKKGEKGEIIREFDPDAERLILSPPMVGG